ncbi:cysteinyl leukotriene receptor 2-like [Erpetoichthys calabaricus]|uniref:cysteinyl leukotriene receptor 2-like n=1 Tax=Erpetoichthys calabaricus TaxID=27687 RepID=UPI0022342957|nr:cysteinyl leukotriene receptor 2-like [Erpetoichthys calabaricus]
MMNMSIDPMNCSINKFKGQVYPVAYLTICVVGFLSNGLSLIIFLKSYKKGSSVNIYMLNLLVSDLLLLCSLPFRAVYYLMECTWIFGDMMCRILSFALYVNMYSSIFFLMALSIMRYLAIVHPYKYVKIRNSDGAKIVCAIVWVTVAAMSIPFLVFRSLEDKGKIKCLELNSANVVMISKLNYVVLVPGFLVPFMTIVICYWFVVKNLQKHKENHKKSLHHQKSIALVIIVTCMFLICFLPYHIIRTVFLEIYKSYISGNYDTCGPLNNIQKAAVFTHCLAASNSCLDPLLYLFVGENFRSWWRKQKQSEELGKMNLKDQN